MAVAVQACSNVELLQGLDTGRPGRDRSYESGAWKNVTLKIMGGNEELTCPMMVASSVAQVRQMLSEATGADPAQIDLFEKKGCKMARLRNSEQVPSKILVKGIPNFGRKAAEYPHPFVIVGAGTLGLRTALHWTKRGTDYVLFERKLKIGGNAWNGIANKWSKLQSEGGHYQLDYDSYDGVDLLRPFNRYSFWPTRDEIIAHYHEVLTEYNMWPNMHMGVQVQDMEITQEPRGAPETLKTYEVKTVHVGSLFNKAQDITDAAHDLFAGRQLNSFVASCVGFFPGALAGPHRRTFPGEEVFGGQVGYGFNDEFDYARVKQQKGIVVGMGAFAVENVRTLMEYDAQKFFVVARHHNLLLPRLISWYCNQSRLPPPAAVVLHAMEPMYALYGMDPWDFFSVQANATRTVASIKQYTRWGIGDVYFLGVFYGKVETIEGQIKRLKRRAAVLTTGRVLTDLDHMVKCLGFDSDFGIDRINKTRRQLGFWPDGDYRRWIASDQSAIDASRFGGTAIAPYAEIQSNWGTHFFEYPQDARTLLDSNVFIENWPKPEVGSAAYHYEPRAAAVVQVSYSASVPALKDFGALSDAFKKASMWCVSPPDRFLEECEKDWYHYCRKFKEFGDDREYPPYPYTLEWVFGLLQAEEEDFLDMTLKQRLLSKEEGVEHRRQIETKWAARLHDAKLKRREREESNIIVPQLAGGGMVVEDGPRPVSALGIGSAAGGGWMPEGAGREHEELQQCVEDRKYWEEAVPTLDPEQKQTFKDRHPEAHTVGEGVEVRTLSEAKSKIEGLSGHSAPQIAHTNAAFIPARMVLRMRQGHSGTNKALTDAWLKSAEQIRTNLMPDAQYF
eukprot:TRINITY_DN3391_c0_g1_i1.p1 TRINITY_DN3391_c0_g1~~TRINITY_DN3391_c0_g1_i1.p1  ORF type:complete len:845 (-),score=139.20 TRINITY_DN3391_c0_g1_i1:37-2571(-)